MSIGSGLLLGVDVGGTFTDAVLVDRATGEMRQAKVLTTPDDQSVGTLATIPELGVVASDLGFFYHGTTAGINAFLQRKGAKVGLICTEGTRDMLDMGRIRRDYSDGLYDPTWVRPQQVRPVVHRRYIREIPARLLYDGSTYVELDEDRVRGELEFLRDEGIESVAVCLLNSYVNLEHEERIVELVREVMPNAYVQSSAVRPVVGEYPRTMAVVIDAYTGPTVVRYLGRLQNRLREQGFAGPAVIMQMNGGVRTIERTMERFPAYTLESGPVAGMLGAEYYGAAFSGNKNLVCVDIGGTSTDIGLVIDGRALIQEEWEAEFAMPLGAPAIDVRSIGAGGGSLIQVDEMGTLRVGPESAGADPGPACYGRGGTSPTITDAHVVLGVLRPESFLGGRMPLDAVAAEAAIGSLARKLEMDPLALAEGAMRLMNANIEAEISKMVFESAVDLRSFALFSYGGAGSMHAADVAHSAGIPEIVVPNIAGGFSALGLATAPAKVEEALSEIEVIDRFGVDRLNELFGRLEARVIEDLAAQGVAREDIQLERILYGMYTGQSFDNKLALNTWPINQAEISAWKARFHAMYDRLYGYSAPEIEITITTLSVTGLGPRPEIKVPELEQGGATPKDEALSGRHRVYAQGAHHDDVPFYTRKLLLAGNRIVGPAVIDDEMSTIVVPPDSVAQVDGRGNIRITFE